jgi:hypothetical protein
MELMYRAQELAEVLDAASGTIDARHERKGRRACC